VAGGQYHTIRVIGTEDTRCVGAGLHGPERQPITRQISLEPVSADTLRPGPARSKSSSRRVSGRYVSTTGNASQVSGSPPAPGAYSFSDVDAGTAHTITVTASGYQTATNHANILAGQVNEVDHYPPAPPYGYRCTDRAPRSPCRPALPSPSLPFRQPVPRLQDSCPLSQQHWVPLFSYAERPGE